MAWFSRRGRDAGSGPLLAIERLDVYYGAAHALQDVSLVLDRGVFAVVGRNGMGKTTLCNAVTGLLPPIASKKGLVRLAGTNLLGESAHAITDRGVGYVPQGRRVWPSLTVDEHLTLAAGSARKGAWTVERVYQAFPRLAERRNNGGAQLSGGEQQMLAISRALLFNPRLLVMDEPTEGLAPVIVEQVANMLKHLAGEGEIAVLLIEQNLGVALEVADRIAVMVNGRIAREISPAELAGDRDLQQRLLGIRASADEAAAEPELAPAATEPTYVFTVKRADDDSVVRDEAAPPAPALRPRNERAPIGAFTRWADAGHAPAAAGADAATAAAGGTVASGHAGGGGSNGAGGGDVSPSSAASGTAMQPADDALGAALAPVTPVAAIGAGGRLVAYVAGTFDTKGRELLYLKQNLDRAGIRTVTVDLATSGASSPASVHPREVARFHPQGERAVFSGDRGSAVSAMALAFERFIRARRDVGGLISAGGSGGTALATPAMRALPIGVPKVMVSSVASGDVRPYVGPSDICMMYSVTDVSGINRISEQVLANAAHALAGMMAHARRGSSISKPALGLTMFGVTTPCVQAVAKLLQDDYDCLVFHATGTGGQSMEKLADSGLLAGVLDITTTEVCDEIVGGVLSAGPDRMDVYARHAIPYVGSCGALDMVNFWAKDTVPAKFAERNLVVHNANVTLMRTTPEECKAIGEFIVKKLNAMRGPVRFVLPEGGVSAIDAPGKPFHDPAADRALFAAIESNFRSGSDHKLVRTPLHVNDPQFAELMVALWREVSGAAAGRGTPAGAGAARNGTTALQDRRAGAARA
jgi:uncharacterized protein (UPF0261 family)/ABC-type branched-subunit amino acid transport system ATPase component